MQGFKAEQTAVELLDFLCECWTSDPTLTEENVDLWLELCKHIAFSLA
jgi:hypothetical protein